jgi:hypothetical protein
MGTLAQERREKQRNIRIHKNTLFSDMPLDRYQQSPYHTSSLELSRGYIRKQATLFAHAYQSVQIVDGKHSGDGSGYRLECLAASVGENSLREALRHMLHRIFQFHLAWDKPRNMCW